MNDPAPKAVFLSYARDDAVPARRIAEALRAVGLKVWFETTELRGGDAWDQKIRKQISDCTLFIAIISKNTEARTTGNFRLEWKVAVDQMQMLAEGVPFVTPVAIDEINKATAVVPPEFLKMPWTPLPGGLPTPEFVEEIQRLMSSNSAPAFTAPPFSMHPMAAPKPAKSKFPTTLLVGLGVAVLVLAAYLILRSAAK